MRPDSLLRLWRYINHSLTYFTLVCVCVHICTCLSVCSDVASVSDWRSVDSVEIVTSFSGRHIWQIRVHHAALLAVLTRTLHVCLFTLSFTSSDQILDQLNILCSAVVRSATPLRQFGTHYRLISLIILIMCFYLVLNAASERTSTKFHSRPSHKRCPRPRFFFLTDIWRATRCMIDWLIDLNGTETKP